MSEKDFSKEIYYTWQDVVKDTKALTKKIQKEFSPEVVVVIANGGWIPARLIKNFISAEFVSLGCRSYNDDNHKLKSFLVYQTVPARIISKKNVLILDEVCDSGRTMQKVLDMIRKMQPAMVYTAVLHQKARAQFEPDFFSRKVRDVWIHYPWEIKIKNKR